MIQELSIRNFGLIDQLTIDFKPGLNVITGETGAGKSILLQALRVLLGAKIKKDQIRNQDQNCLLQCVLQLPSSLQELDFFQDLHEDGEMIIQRTFPANGKAKTQINGLAVAQQQLLEIASYLIDFHGPHDHHLLFEQHRHREFLDRMISFDQSYDRYREVFTQYSDLKQQLNELNKLADGREREIEILQFQLNELDQVSLDDDEYDYLISEKNKIQNAERIHDSLATILQHFDQEELNVTERVQKCFGPLEKLVELDPSCAPLLEALQIIQDQSQQLSYEINHYADALSFSPEQAEEILQRYHLFEDLKRKYGPTLKDAKQFREEIREKVETLKNFESSQDDLVTQMNDLESDLEKFATKIHQQRSKVATTLSKQIEKQLQDLGIKHAQFAVKLDRSSSFDEFGFDDVAFHISPNAGEELKPLADIVSSGEAARVILGLKRALIDVDPVAILVFDEIDAQIGGRLGKITGTKLKEMSVQRQLLLITHLPQIAAFADHHLKVVKQVVNKRTETSITSLNQDDQIAELAYMLGDDDDSAFQQAKKLLAANKRCQAPA